MNSIKQVFVCFLIALCAFAPYGYSQNLSGGPPPTAIQPATPYYTTVPISATAAVNTQTLLTIPAPATGLFNYICDLKYEVANDNTGTVVTTAVTTSSNFNSFAVKFSQIATASVDSGVQTVLGPYTPAGGCIKSAAPATATIFAGAIATHATWTWYATYYQAP